MIAQPNNVREQGFTLIEVMVALAILAVVAVTAMQAAATYTQSVSNMQARTLAHFVAQNTLADLRLNQQWLTAPQTQQVTAQGQSWQVTLTPSDTPVDTVQQIRIAVAPIDEGGNVLHNLIDFEAMLIKPVRSSRVANSPTTGQISTEQISTGQN